MIKAKYFLLFLTLLCGSLYAHTIKGVVHDEKDLPISGAFIYLDGSTLSVYSDHNGNFEIQSKSKVFSSLVVSALGYETLWIKDPFGLDFHNIKMSVKINQLSEVLVGKTKSRFKREDKLKVFREEFLGKTIAGKYCKILNESDIVLSYNTKKRRLTASCDAPVKIYNAFLGYQLEYHIKECYIDFEWTTLKNSAILGWKFSGTTFFKDLTNDSTSYAAKRKMSYKNSPMEFFRNLSHKTLGDDNFSLLHGSRYCDPENYFIIKERENDYIIMVKNDRIKRKESFYQSFILEYPGKPDSKVIFESNVFRVDRYGNYNASKSISFLGEISDKRIGDLLPMDYNMK